VGTPDDETGSAHRRYFTDGTKIHHGRNILSEESETAGIETMERNRFTSLETVGETVGVGSVEYTGADGRCTDRSTTGISPPTRPLEPLHGLLHPLENLIRRAQPVDAGELGLTTVILEQGRRLDLEAGDPLGEDRGIVIGPLPGEHPPHQLIPRHGEFCGSDRGKPSSKQPSRQSSASNRFVTIPMMIESGTSCPCSM
jgi:hypothetical protein